MDKHPTITILLASNRTGKTTFVKQKILKKYKKVLIVNDSYNKDWDGIKLIDATQGEEMRRFKGKRQIHFIEHGKETWDMIYNNVRKTLIVFDDAKMYIEPSLSQNGNFKRLLGGFTHTMESDLLFIFHSPDQVMKKLYEHANFLLIGYTTVLADHRMRLEKINEIIEAQKITNERYRKAYHKKNGSHYGLFSLIKLKM